MFFATEGNIGFISRVRLGHILLHDQPRSHVSETSNSISHGLDLQNEQYDHQSFKVLQTCNPVPTLPYLFLFHVHTKSLNQ